VHAIGLNRADLLYLAGAHYVPSTYPSRICVEACGVVDAVGEGVTNFGIGDRVTAIPCPDPDYAVGGQWAITPARFLMPWPAGVPAERACAFWMQYGTAYYPPHEYRRIGPADTVLITAASSSAGLGAIHLARLLGATVIATSRSHAKTDQLRAQGAHHVIATEVENLAERVMQITGGTGVGLVFDAVAGRFIRSYIDAMAQNAHAYIYGALGGDPSIEYPIAAVLRRGITLQPYSAIPPMADPVLLRRMKQFLSLAQQAGHLCPVVDRVFAFDQVRDAYDHMLGGTQIGKIVLHVR
jgi:NADPH2:quinone reductase